ncbi:hypothetical protein [Clostridium beijerinckii]|uniref:Uncharacterized protein n=1 Tax=Clostridium beijerinckii TaxID=1520 RepID=A0A1S8SC14_CLOBE|nr:hypothetical protein [Clostridium beijerinckii]NRY61911.1 uroporphyrinogen-III decarboxylase [Clostridium beijerinckii]OOM62997.1 hypothetical protein CLBCK_14660 [Clostridium beijerinckii]
MKKNKKNSKELVDKEIKININIQQNAGVKSIVTLDYVTGNVHCEEHERYDTNVSKEILENVIKENKESLSHYRLNII